MSIANFYQSPVGLDRRQITWTGHTTGYKVYISPVCV